MNLFKQFFKGFKKGMSNFGEDVSTIVNSILLFIVYLIGIGITSIFAKIIGKHFIESKISTKRKTYWSNLNLNKKPINTYYRQF